MMGEVDSERSERLVRDIRSIPIDLAVLVVATRDDGVAVKQRVAQQSMGSLDRQEQACADKAAWLGTRRSQQPAGC